MLTTIVPPVRMIALLLFAICFTEMATSQVLPLCGCESFRNGLTTDDIGGEACAKIEVHGLSGKQTWCMPPQGPFIQSLDDGCGSDAQRVSTATT